MRKSFILLFSFFLAFLLAGSFDADARKKTKKIIVTPSEARIYVDGQYVADGTYELVFKKDDFYVIKLDYPGYVTKELKVFKDDDRNTLSFTLREDESYWDSELNELANQYFTIQVNPSYDPETAWKLINQVILEYFDEIKTADRVSGFLVTPWKVKMFPSSELKVRTRVSVKEITTGNGLTYQIKIASEIAPLSGREQSFKPWDRVLKKYESLINEMQTRLR